jgi:phosphoglycolate phosphatase
LSARGISHSVLSATERSTLQRQCEHHGMQHAIATWVGLDDRLAHSKVGAGRRWLEAQALRPVDVVLVGDTVHDHEVALELGVDCMLVEGGHQDAGRLRATGARVCRDLTEVLVAISGA